MHLPAHLTRRVAGVLAMAAALAGCSDATDAEPSDAVAADTDEPFDGSDAADDTRGTDASDSGDDTDLGDTAGTGDTGTIGDVGDTAETAPPSTVPTKPIAFTKNKPFTIDSGTTNYVFVPDAYDSSHKTPITLFVWLHGCGGFSSGDIWTVSPGGSKQTWISLAVGGREGDCWDMGKDPPRVLTAIADLKTHFNIKAKGTILGGYSSGGDLTYRIAFYNAAMFAGALVENTSPYRDTGSTQAASLAAAAWKFNVVHLAHLQDSTYPIAGVRKETDSMTAAGFPMKRIEVAGNHYDDPGAIVGGSAVPGTSADIATYLFPYLSAGWTAP
jgi:hypothetical protein